MVDQTTKNQNQTQQKTGTDTATSKAAGTLQTGNKTTEMVAELRNTNNVQGLALSALYKTATSESIQKGSVKSTPTSLRSKSADRDRKQHKPTHGESSSSEAEVRELNAIQTANRTATASAASSRGTASARTGVRAPGQDGALDLDEELTASLQHNLVGQDQIEDGISSGIKTSADTNTDQQDRNSAEVSQTPEQALDSIELNTSTETIKLLDLVGPEAVLTFREKLQQVWVTLDDNAARQLDVVARMPATLSGASAMELLMVESPQGIHFVAFLKNKNDFEVLATFDRRALLPESPSRQLIEAGLMSYEQLDSVFKEGGNKIEQAAKELAATRGTNDAVFNEIQRLMVQEKRRRRKFRQMMDYFIDKLDELDLEGDPDEAPFVPKDLSKDKSEGIEKGQLEKEIEEELAKLDQNIGQEKDGFALNPEDSEYH